ncbi:MAG: nitroreductase family protein [Anaerolineaceae bacterium]|nr:nitroreductase family protein [Anaerolineaceae bacterium]MBN2676942.1 nitroreductase family protein [Anaerolineaceae bacterium]
MDVYKAINSRKTIRDFSHREIKPATLNKIILAGFKAPSNNHLREWHFILLQDRIQRKALLGRIIHPVDRQGAITIVNRWGLTDEKQCTTYIEAIPKQYNMLYTAGALIYPCYLQPTPLLKPRSLSEMNPLVSIWCCIENILVAAAAEGIFGVTRILFEDERRILKKILKIPTKYEVPCHLALGYPASDAKRLPQVEIDINERIHMNSW